MDRTARKLGSVAAACTLAALLAACSDGRGGGGGGMYGGGVTSSPAGGAAGAATVTTEDTELGLILVDADGFTLYLFEQDTGSSSTCTDDCAVTWPPLLTDGAASGENGVTGALGTTTRDDGTTQVTYEGHPLYRYSGDGAAGDTNGQGLSDVWFAVTPGGTPAAGPEPQDDGYTRDYG